MKIPSLFDLRQHYWKAVIAAAEYYIVYAATPDDDLNKIGSLKMEYDVFRLLFVDKFMEEQIATQENVLVKMHKTFMGDVQTYINDYVAFRGDLDGN